MPYLYRSLPARLTFLASLVIFVFASSGIGQEKNKPDLAISNIQLGDRASAKKFLGNNQPGYGDGVPAWYFYNSRVTSVLKLTGLSEEDPYFLTGLEVYSIGDSYQGRHFVSKDIGTFQTDSGIFVGFRQSGKGIALAMIVGIPNISRDSMIGPKDVIGIKGEPADRTKEDTSERLTYVVPNVALPDSEGKNYGYTAQYTFRNKKLKRFLMTIAPATRPQEAKVKQ